MGELIGFIKKQHSRTWFAITVILVFCYVSFTLPMQIWGLPSGFDLMSHVRFAAAFQDGLASGQLFPSWANDNFGYGSIGIRFYPPISGYILAITHLFTNDWIAAFLISSYVWMCVGCVGVYLFIKDWGKPGYGVLAATLYAIVPYHLAEFFRFFMYGEFAAWAIIPFCFLFLSRICRGGTWFDTIFFAIAYSILILTHIPTTIIVSFCLPVYVLLLIDWNNYKRVCTHLVAGIALTLLATAFRWVMLVNEVTWLAHNGREHFMTDFYDFGIWLFPNFVAPNSPYIYILTDWLFDVAVVLTVALLIPAVLNVVWRTSKPADSSFKKIIIASLATAGFAFFMLSRPSYYVWDNIELLQKLQFPLRWMCVLSFFSVVLFSLSIEPLMLRLRKVQRLVVYPAIGLVAAILLFDITQLYFPSVPIPKAEYVQIDQEIYTEQIWKAWWPIWAKEEAFENREKVVASDRKVDIAYWDRESKEFVVQPGEPTNVGVRSFYYPRWKATVNDRVAEIGRDENGAITIPVSSEASRVRLYFEEPLSIKVSYVVSSVTWLLGFCLMLVVYGRQYIPSMSSKPLIDEEYDYS
jgi:hypothetical protein